MSSVFPSNTTIPIDILNRIKYYNNDFYNSSTYLFMHIPNKLYKTGETCSFDLYYKGQTPAKIVTELILYSPNYFFY